MKVDLRNFKRYIASWDRRMKRAIPKALNKSGNKVRELILDRTSRGVGLKGRFKRDDSQYKDYRTEKGRGSTPDLNFSGRMLGNIDVSKSGTNKVLVAFKRKEEAKKAKFNQKSRPFFGVKPDEKKFVVAAFTRQLKRDLR